MITVLLWYQIYLKKKIPRKKKCELNIQPRNRIQSIHYLLGHKEWHSQRLTLPMPCPFVGIGKDLVKGWFCESHALPCELRFVVNNVDH